MAYFRDLDLAVAVAVAENGDIYYVFEVSSYSYGYYLSF